MNILSEIFRKADASGNDCNENETVGWLHTVINTLIV